MKPNSDFKYIYEDREIESKNIEVNGGSRIIQGGQRYRALVYDNDRWNTAHIIWNFEQKEAGLTKVDLDSPLRQIGHWLY